jgi:hypothetical protein
MVTKLRWNWSKSSKHNDPFFFQICNGRTEREPNWWIEIELGGINNSKKIRNSWEKEGGYGGNGGCCGGRGGEDEMVREKEWLRWWGDGEHERERAMGLLSSILWW